MWLGLRLRLGGGSRVFEGVGWLVLLGMGIDDGGW